MITLRQLVKSDAVIASITTEECHFIAAVLDIVLKLTSSFLFRRIIPKEIRVQTLKLRMLAAALGRTASEREPNMSEQIRLAMERDRHESA